MLSAKCPGQDRRNWKPEDVLEHNCPHCGTVLEFWKTDAKVKCHHCRTKVLNPNFNLGCALWCSYADQCVGDISSVFTERPEALRDRLEMGVRRYFIGESERLQFTVQAAEVASRLLEKEKEAEPPVVLAAVLFHDAGFKKCLEEGKETTRLSSCILQKSREIAKEIMGEINLLREVQKSVLEILENSSSGEKDNVNYQLWQDIITLASFKRAEKAAGKNALHSLHRQSAIDYAKEEDLL